MRPHAPSGVAAFMSAHSKTPYITPSMDFPSVNGVARGRGGAAAVMCVAVPVCMASSKGMLGHHILTHTSSMAGAAKSDSSSERVSSGAYEQRVAASAFPVVRTSSECGECGKARAVANASKGKAASEPCTGVTTAGPTASPTSTDCKQCALVFDT